MARKKGARKMPIQAMREVLADGKRWTAIGVVKVPKGQTTHYEISDHDILVEVELVDTEQAILCKLSNSGGLYHIPAVGDEVVVAFRSGDVQDAPRIVGLLGSRAPSGLTATTIVIMCPAGGQVLIHDGDSGEAQPLARRQDVLLLQDHINAQFGPAGHTHVVSGAATTTVTRAAAAPEEISYTSDDFTQTLKGK